MRLDTTRSTVSLIDRTSAAALMGAARSGRPVGTRGGGVRSGQNAPIAALRRRVQIGSADVSLIFCMGMSVLTLCTPLMRVRWSTWNCR